MNPAEVPEADQEDSDRTVAHSQVHATTMTAHRRLVSSPPSSEHL